MYKQFFRKTAFMALISVASFAGAQEGPSSSCATFALNDTISNPSATKGNYLAVAVGDTFTFTMTPGTASSASWRIVNDGSGLPASTLTAGGTVSNTLTYTVTVANVGVGVGYYVDSINGTATLTASCRSGSAINATAVPTLSEWGLLLTGAALALASAVAMRRRRAEAS